MTQRRRLRPMLVGAAAAVVLVAAWAAPGGTSRPTETSSKGAIVFNGQGNNLNAYTADPPFTKQNVIRNHDDDPNGLDINAQICFFPDGSKTLHRRRGHRPAEPAPGLGDLRSCAGEHSRQALGEEGRQAHADLSGPATTTPRTTGAGFSPTDRVLTTDIGNQASGPEDGQLIVWFPPFDQTKVRYCKLDVGIATAGGIYVDSQGPCVRAIGARADCRGVALRRSVPDLGHRQRRVAAPRTRPARRWPRR